MIGKFNHGGHGGRGDLLILSLLRSSNGHGGGVAASEGTECGYAAEEGQAPSPAQESKG